MQARRQLHRHPVTRQVAASLSTVVMASAALTVTGCSADSSSPSASPAASATASSSSSAINSPGSSTRTGAPTSSSAKPRTSPWNGREVVLGGSGDLLVHTAVADDARKNASGQGFDFTPMFADVRSLISEPDVSLCHLETPLSANNRDLTKPGGVSFNAPRELATAAKNAGFDGCDRVSNHVFDRGLAGIGATQRVLDAAGLKSQGPTTTDSGPQQAVTYEVRGMKIAHLAYTYTSENALQPNTTLPTGMPWMKHWQFPNIGAAGILADAQRAKDSGADVVVLSMHWGTQYETKPTPMQRSLAKQLLSSDAVDVILGDHVHVPQTCERINGRFVAYGMGNFLSNQGHPDSGVPEVAKYGMFVRVSLTRDAHGHVVQKMTYQPTRINLANHHIERATATRNVDAYRHVTSVMKGSGCPATPAS